MSRITKAFKDFDLPNSLSVNDLLKSKFLSADTSTCTDTILPAIHNQINSDSSDEEEDLI